MGRRIPDTLNGNEGIQLLKQPNLKAPTGLRDATMMRLMLNAGLRSSEVLSLKTSDIDWISGKVLIKEGKGKKDRVVWVNESDLDYMRRWKEIKPESKYLFTTLKGTKIIDRYLRAMVKRRGVRAGIRKNIYPHLLRHSFATDLLRETKNIRLVQKALGHANISTTMIYTHIYDDELADAMKTFRR